MTIDIRGVRREVTTVVHMDGMPRSRTAAVALVSIVALATIVQTLVNPLTVLLTGSAQWAHALPLWAVALIVAGGCAAQAASLLIAVRAPVTGLLATVACYLGLIVLIGVPNWLASMQIVIAGAFFLLGAKRGARVAVMWLLISLCLIVGVMFLWVIGTGAPPATIATFVAAQAAGVASLCAGGTALGVWWGVQTRRARAARAALDRAKSDEARELDEARTAERIRIAQELHDVAGQHLAGMVALADGAHTIAAKSPDRALELLEEIRAEGRFATASVYAALGDLRAGEDLQSDATPTLRQLPDLIDYWLRHGLRLTAEVTADVADLPTVISATAYRGAQESLTNAAKHAPGSVVVLSLRRRDGTLVMRIENGVAGVSTAPHATIGLGWGLDGIRQRVDLLHGTVVAGPTAEGGWRVLIEIPLDEHADAALNRR